MHIHGSEIAEPLAFQAQVWAHVLVASSSGFSRFAAVLSKNTVIAPEVLSHPLAGLRNVLSVYHRSFWTRRDGFGAEEAPGGEGGFNRWKDELRSELHRNLHAQFRRDSEGAARLSCIRGAGSSARYGAR